MRRALQLVALLCSAVAASAQDGAAPAGDEPTALEIIFDASGSMEKETARAYSRELKVRVAREELQAFVRRLSGRPTLQIALRVFGTDTAKGCGDSVLVRGFGAPDEELVTKIGEMTPAPFGRTPIALSLASALEDFRKLPGSQPTHRSILLITDGVETCDGDVDESIDKIKKSGIALKVHIVGYDVLDWDDPGQKKLEEAARATGGTAVYPKSREELQEDLTQIAKKEELVETPAPPPPPKPRTFMDRASENVVVIGVAVGVLLLLAAGLVLRLRSR